MIKKLKNINFKFLILTFGVFFCEIGCSPIKMTPEELNDVVIDNPNTTIIVDPSTGVILGTQIENHQPEIDDIEAFPFCHCFMQRECHDGRDCIASYCRNCDGVDPSRPAKIICI